MVGAWLAYQQTYWDPDSCPDLTNTKYINNYLLLFQIFI